MKGQWIKVGPTETPYCEVVAFDGGTVYISVQSGDVRTSDYLNAADAERVGQAIVIAARLAASTRTVCEVCGCEEFCISYLRDELAAQATGPGGGARAGAGT